MPFEFREMNSKLPEEQGIAFHRVMQESAQKTSGQETLSSTREVPTARLVGLAGVAGGLTELTAATLNNQFARNVADAASTVKRGDLYGGIDKLAAARGSMITDLNLKTPALSAQHIGEVDKFLNSAGHTAAYHREAHFHLEAAKESASTLKGELGALRAERNVLMQSAPQRAAAFDISHNDSIILRHSGDALKRPLVAEDLKTFAAKTFNEGSLFRNALTDKSAKMAAGEVATPASVIDQALPEWNRRLAQMNGTHARWSHVQSQIDALKDFEKMSGPELSAAAARRTPDGTRALLAADDAVGAAFRNYRVASFRGHESTLRLAASYRDLGIHSSELAASTAKFVQPSGAAFIKGFGKGAVGMTAGIAAGYALDKAIGSEDLAINSPGGLFMDGAAGVIAASNMPGRYKIPLALAAVAAPRALEYAVGERLSLAGPAGITGDSLWAPNAVDAIGFGVAAAAPADGKTRLVIAAGAFGLGRVYNAYNSRSENKMGLDSSIKLLRN